MPTFFKKFSVYDMSDITYYELKVRNHSYKGSQ